MTGDRARLEAALEAVEARLRQAPMATDPQAERAGLLAALGRTDQAKQAYLEILAQDPAHFVTLNNFGVLLHENQYRTAARTLFSEAVRRHPDQPLGHINLANLLMQAEELEAARAHYEMALRLDPENTHAHQRLAGLSHERGDIEAMRRHRRLGFSSQPLQSHPYLGDGDPIAVLVLSSMPAGDIAWPKLFDSRTFSVTTIAAAFYDPALPLPPHQLIFNAIGDADVSREDLHAAQALTARSPALVINRPESVLATGRASNAERLRGLPGVVTPRTWTYPRSVFATDAGREGLESDGFEFPLLLRSPGFHTGRHFVRVEAPAQLAAAAAGLPGPELVVMQFLDARGRDGYVRKYRVMMIGDALYPLHLAISEGWKVHYATSAMDEHSTFRTEEARFLRSMAAAISEKGVRALRAVQGLLELDYGGIDFALDDAGNLIVFEANAVMTMLPPDDQPQWEYRRGAFDRAAQAARVMLVERAKRGSPAVRA
jgi:Flp pilus assembly protein TadD/glutathione synthase/RimK-type ligase-like ATP-grasp enzyme